MSRVYEVTFYCDGDVRRVQGHGNTRASAERHALAVIRRQGAPNPQLVRNLTRFVPKGER